MSNDVSRMYERAAGVGAPSYGGSINVFSGTSKPTVSSHATHAAATQAVQWRAQLDQANTALMRSWHAYQASLNESSSTCDPNWQLGWIARAIAAAKTFLASAQTAVQVASQTGAPSIPQVVDAMQQCAQAVSRLPPSSNNEINANLVQVWDWIASDYGGSGAGKIYNCRPYGAGVGPNGVVAAYSAAGSALQLAYNATLYVAPAQVAPPPPTHVVATHLPPAFTRSGMVPHSLGAVARMYERAAGVSGAPCGCGGKCGACADSTRCLTCCNGLTPTPEMAPLVWQGRRHRPNCSTLPAGVAGLLEMMREGPRGLGVPMHQVNGQLAPQPSFAIAVTPGGSTSVTIAQDTVLAVATPVGSSGANVFWKNDTMPPPVVLNGVKRGTGPWPLGVWPIGVWWNDSAGAAQHATVTVTSLSRGRVTHPNPPRGLGDCGCGPGPIGPRPIGGDALSMMRAGPPMRMRPSGVGDATAAGVAMSAQTGIIAESAAVGAAGAAVVGLLIGWAADHPGTGAIVGALGGGVAGAFIGSSAASTLVAAAQAAPTVAPSSSSSSTTPSVSA